MKKIIKLFVATFAAVVLGAFAQAAESVARPNATIQKLSAMTLTAAEHKYNEWTGSLKAGTVDRPLQIVMNLKAQDTLAQAQASGYGKYICDFYLTFSGIKDGSLTAKDCYLAGNYGTFGWIVIPTDEVTVENGISYPVVSGYDAKLTYENICDYVKDFTAAIYIAPAILDANPNFKVTLSLRMTNPENSDDYFTVGESYMYTAKELKEALLPKATVEKLPAMTLTAAEHKYNEWTGSLKAGTVDRPLQIVMNLKAQDTLSEAKASGYGKYICDFYLSFDGIENDLLTAENCYLAGNYGTFGWIVIPTDEVTVENGVFYPVVSGYDAKLTYENICDYVKDFTAAIYIAPAILDANPNFKVTLSLRMTNPDNADDYFTVGEAYAYTVADLKGANAPTVTVDEKVTEDIAALTKEVANAMTEAYQATDKKLAVKIVEKTEKTATFDITANEYTVPAEGLKMTFPVEAVEDGKKAVIVHRHNGKTYVTTGEVRYGFVSYFNTLGFSEFTVGDATALSEALAAGGDVILNSDIALTEMITIPAGVTVTLDLNGKAITVPETTGNHIYAFQNKGNLTIKDSVGSGSISARGIYNGVSGSEANADIKMTIESGNFFAIDSNGGACIFNYAELEVKDGTFEGIVAAINMNSGTVTINGGTFRTVSSGKYVIQNNGGSLTVNDATVDRGFGAVGCYNGTTVINGGSYLPTGRQSATCHVVYVAAAANVTINGGTFKMNYLVDAVPESGSAVSSYFNGNVSITGGTFTSHFDNVSPVELSSGSEITGGMFLVHSGAASTHAYITNYVKDGYELGADGAVEPLPVAQIGEVKYATLKAAATSAQAGDTIKLLSDVTITEKLTLPAGITFDGNSKSITGAEVWADGNLTFVGHTKMTMFNAGYNKPTITIGEGACLELVGTGRMVIGHGATFNITGNIGDAKIANVAEITPSLIAAGASFTGAGVNFNVNNAYVKFTAYCSSKNSNASETFNINVTNSIWEQANTLVFSEPTNGKDPTFNFNVVNSVLNSTSHLVFGVTKGEIVFDNSNVNVGAAKQLENRSTLTIKNGSVVHAITATNENAKNPGTMIVENATLVATGEFTGAEVGTGTLVIKKGANISMGKITKANITIDATDMTEGELANFSANLSGLTGTLTVVNNDKLEASIVDGKIVLTKKPAAKIGDVGYETFAAAYAAAQAGDIITLFADVKTTGTLTIDKAITIDGNGCSIIADHTNFILVTSADCVLKNIVLDTNNKAKGVKIASGNVIFETVTIPNSNKSDAITVASGAKLTFSKYIKIASTYTIIDAKAGIVNAEVGTVFDITTFRGNVSPATSDLKGAVDTNGNSFFCAYGSTSYYKTLSGVPNTITDLTLLADVELNGNLSVKGTLNLNGNDLTIAEGKQLKLSGNTTITGDGTVEGEIYLDPKYTLTSSIADLNVTTASGNKVVYENGAYVSKTPVAKIGEVTYVTLAEAIAAAQSGDTVEIIADIALESSIVIPAEMTLTIDGKGHKLTPATGFAVDGNNAVLVLANGDRGYSSDSKYTVKDLAFEGFTNLSRVIRANFCDAVIENCTFTGNSVVGGVITSAEAELTVTSCKFESNIVSGDAGYGVIDIGSDVSAGTTAVANIVGNTFKNNTVEYAVVFLFSSANVTGNYFNGNIHAGTNSNAAAILAGPYTGNMAYAINITDNAFDSALIKDAEVLPSVFAEDWSSLGSTTSFDLSSNYWGGEEPVKGADYQTNVDTAKPVVDSYYTAFSIDEDGAVVLENKVAIITPVAKIGDTPYATLEAAIAAAQEGDTVEIIASTIDFAENAASIVVNKAITIKGAGAQNTTLNFNSASSAFVVKSSNVVFKNMTITQGSKDNSFHISIDKGAWDAPAIQYAGIVIENVSFDGGNYALCLIGKDIVVDGCMFNGQSSHNIIVYSLKGDSKVINNTFNASTKNNKSAILWEGGVSTTLTEEQKTAFMGGGKLTVSGNEANAKGVFFQFTNWGLVKDLAVEITENVIDSFTNKAIALYDMDGAVLASGDEFASFVVENNVFLNVPDGCPILKEYTATVEVFVDKNYLDSSEPVPEVLFVGGKVDVAGYYASYENGELDDYVACVAPVAKIGDTTYATLLQAFAAAKSGDTVSLLGDLTLQAGDIDYYQNIKIPAGVTFDGGNYELVVMESQDGDYAVIWSDGAYTVQNLSIKVMGRREANRSVFNFSKGGKISNVKIWAQVLDIGVIYDKPVDGMSLIVENCEISNVTYAFYCDSNASDIDVTIKNNVINSQRFGSMWHDERIEGNTLTATCTKGISLGASFTGTVTGNTFAGARALSVYGNQTISGNVLSSTSIVELNNGAVADLSGNYWGGEAPSESQIVADGATSVVSFTVENYYTNVEEDGTLSGLVTVASNVAEVNGVQYATLQAAVNAAQEGDTVTVLADISDVTVEVAKNITISGSVALNNVGINAVGATEMTVSGLNFTGNSWINAGTATKLTVSGVSANVTPSNAAYTNSRNAFISLGRSEQHNLELVVKNCNIVSNGGSDPILGWAAITKATITDSTFGSESAYQSNSDSIKFMAIADGAEFYISGNKIYSNYNGVVFGQNTTRGNSYTAVFENNKFFGGADHIWIEISGSSVCHATINVASNNTVNGNPMVAGDIKAHTGVIKSWTSYAGIDVATDESGKVIGGVLAFYGADAIADGYEVASNGVVQKKPVAMVGGVKYATLEAAITAAVLDDVIIVLTDVAVSSVIAINGKQNLTLDLNGKTVTSSVNSMFQLQSSGLTITDSSEEKTGKIDCVNSEVSGGNAFIVYSDSSLTIKDGTIHAWNNVIYAYGTGIDISMNGGEIKSFLTGQEPGRPLYLVYANGDSSIVVNDGTVIGPILCYDSNLVVNGGQFSIDPNSWCAPGYKANYNESTGFYEVKEDVVEPVDPSVAMVRMVFSDEDKYYASLSDAVSAAQLAGVEDVEITIIGTNASSSPDDFDLYEQTVFNNVTIKQDNGNKPYYIDSLYTGRRVSSKGRFVFDGVNIVVTGQYITECKTVLANNSILKRTNDNKNFIYYADMIVEPGAKYDSQIDDILGGSISVNGGLDSGYNTEYNLKSIYFTVREGQVFNVISGAYVLINAANENGTLTLDGTVNIAASKLSVFNEIAIGANGFLNMDALSVVDVKRIIGTGAIKIDARVIKETEKQVIFADMSGFNGTITVEGGTYEKLNNGVVIKREVANAYFDGYYYEKFEDAFADAMYSDMSKVSISVLGDSTVGTMEIPAGKSMVLDLGGKTLTKADDATIVVNNANVKFTNGTLDGFTSANVEIMGDSVVTFPANTVELSDFDDTFYKVTNEDGSVSVATVFRSYIQVEDSVPCVGFLKDKSSNYCVYGKVNLTDSKWTLLNMPEVDGVISKDPALPLKWFAPGEGEEAYHFFKVEMTK